MQSSGVMDPQVLTGSREEMGDRCSDGSSHNGSWYGRACAMSESRFMSAFLTDSRADLTRCRLIMC